MDKLWKKENEGCFVNLFDSEILHWIPFKNFLKRNLRGIEVNDQEKNNVISSRFRDEGNKVFKKKKYQNAMEFYNLSLQFAEVGTDNMSKAYANRSACFLHMQKYDKCLIDIGLAKNANYPIQLMHKLTERETKCMKKLEDKPQKNQVVHGWELSYLPNEHFPGMANILELRYNEEYGRHIIANEDIDVGKIVLMEDAILFGDGPINSYSFCDACAKYETNFIPCPNCVNVMFCNEECMRSNTTHKLVCGATYGKSVIAQSILVAITTFNSNIEYLMEFVENIFQTDQTSNLPIKSTDLRSKYEFFLKLMALPRIDNEDESLVLYKNLMNIDRIRILFNSKQKQRFLMHLILQHTMILNTNMMNVSIQYPPIKLCKVHNIISLFNHSCMPNLIVMSDVIKSIVITIRPVKKGKQLFIIYLNNMLNMETELRQSILEQKFHFKCKCSKCLPCTEFQTENIMLNEKYQEILSKPLPLEFFSDDERELYKNECCEFLNEFGHLPWSKSIDKIMVRFMMCLYNEHCNRMAFK